MSKFKRYTPSLTLWAIYGSVFFSFWLAFPGVVYTDTIIQFKDVLSGSFGDWQMPIMIGWWRLLHRLFPVAPLNLFLFQNFLFLAAFHLLHFHLKEKASRWAIAALAWTPPVLAANGVLWKDSQMAAAFLLAFGLGISAHKVIGRERKIILWILFGLAIFYGTGIRHNAAAALPFLFLAIWSTKKKKTKKKTGAKELAVSFVSTFAVFAFVQLVSDALTDRDYYPSQIIKAYDLAGIRKFGGKVEYPSYFNVRAELAYSDSTVNDLFFKGPKPVVGMVFERKQVEELHKLWQKAILDNPVAYLRHKLAVYGVFIRLKKADRDYYDVQVSSVRNSFGWRQRLTPAKALFHKALKLFEGSVFFKPWIWLVVSLGLLFAQVNRRLKGASDSSAAMMLNLSGLVYFTGMFPILPSAIEFRYFFWTYIATTVSAAIFIGGNIASKGKRHSPLS